MMSAISGKARSSLPPGILSLTLTTVYLIALLSAEEQMLIIGLLSAAVVLVVAAHYAPGWPGSR